MLTEKNAELPTFYKPDDDNNGRNYMWQRYLSKNS